jgi:hypothetical protein
VVCSKPLSRGVLPTRLVEVGHTNSSLRLRSSCDLPSQTLYIALSHCWGSKPIITLTKENFSDFHKDLPASQLSKTFQDAIFITRLLQSRFGIRYLWIDSLCIIQDCPEDWIHEAPRIADVYGNAWCTLAASGSPDGSTGLLLTKAEPRVPPVIAPFVEAEKTNALQVLCLNWERNDNNITNAPLGRRAWALQERYLSSRILHFAVDEIYWSCQVFGASETYWKGDPAFMKGDSIRGNPITSIVRVPDVLDLMEAKNAWHWAVCHFAGAGLTVAQDKFFAISGIAKQFQRIFHGSEYLAGLWKFDIERQLVWRTREVSARTLLQSCDPYVAPSWSWASAHVELYIDWMSEKFGVVGKVVDCYTTLSSSDAFGPISSGLLRLQGPLYACQLFGAEDPMVSLEGEEFCIDAEYYPDISLFSIPEGGGIYCALICEQTLDTWKKDVKSEYTWKSNERLLGLVIQRIGDNRGQYRRIGSFRTVFVEDGENNAIGHPKPIVLKDVSAYESFDGVETYTYSII